MKNKNRPETIRKEPENGPYLHSNYADSGSHFTHLLDFKDPLEPDNILCYTAGHYGKKK
jgi:hypothetical protein